MEHTFHVSIIKSPRAVVPPTSVIATLESLKQMVLETEADNKASLPLLKLARFGDKRSSNLSYRTNENVVSVSGVEMDYDAKRVEFSEAERILRTNSIRSLLYTSPGDLYGAPKWRVVCPTSQEVSPEDRAFVAARVNGLFGGIFSRESFTLSQPFYYGKVRNNLRHKAVICEGDFVDLRDDLSRSALTPVAVRRPKREEDIDGEVDPVLVAYAMSVIRNDDLDWNTWNTIGMALWKALDGRHFEMFDEWSQRSDKYNARETQDRWQTYFRCPPKDLGVGSIFYMANQSYPSWRDEYYVTTHREAMTAEAALHRAARKELEHDQRHSPSTTRRPAASSSVGRDHQGWHPDHVVPELDRSPSGDEGGT